eukprot:5406550-Prymnesium_polylepis.1
MWRRPTRRAARMELREGVAGGAKEDEGKPEREVEAAQVAHHPLDRLGKRERQVTECHVR